VSMSGSGMAASVKAQLVELASQTGQGDITFLRDDILTAFCEGIVAYIQSNAVVNSTGTVDSGEGAGGAVTAVGEIE